MQHIIKTLKDCFFRKETPKVYHGTFAQWALELEREAKEKEELKNQLFAASQHLARIVNFEGINLSLGLLEHTKQTLSDIEQTLNPPENFTD